MKTLGNIKRALAGLWYTTFQKCPRPSDLAAKEVIGTSKEGRDIVSYRVGSGKNTIVIAAAIHGNEVGTAKLAFYLLDHLAKQKEIPDVTYKVVPVLNPDGYSQAKSQPDFINGGRIGRFNANGVDLNRNFDTPTFTSPAKWVHGKAYQDSTEVFAGKYPNSEPETKALLSLLDRNHMSGCVMLHSAGADVLGNKVSPAPEAAAEFSGTTGYKLITDAVWQKLFQTGSLKEWCEIRNIPYIEIECSSRWDSDWKRQKTALPQVIDRFSTA